MTAEELDTLIRGFADAGSDFRRIWNVAAARAADIVEIRHVPPSPQLDGFRSKADFIAYVEEEARVLPRAFEPCTIRLDVERTPSGLVWNPLSLSGPLIGSGRIVDIRFRVQLHFAGGKLVRVDGSPTPETPKADIIDWLKSIERVGGFNPPPAMAGRPQA